MDHMGSCALFVLLLLLLFRLQGFWATERLGRLGEDMIYVRLRDGRGWVFETLNGKKVLERVAPSTLPPPVESS